MPSISKKSKNNAYFKNNGFGCHRQTQSGTAYALTGRRTAIRQPFCRPEGQYCLILAIFPLSPIDLAQDRQL